MHKKLWYVILRTSINSIWHILRNYYLFHGMHVKSMNLYIINKHTLYEFID